MRPTAPFKPIPFAPNKIRSFRREIARTKIFDGDELKFVAGRSYYFDYQYDGDVRDDWIVEFEQVTEANPNYEKELVVYNSIQEKYLADLVDYEARLKLWESKEQERKLATFNRLKEELGL